MDKKTKNKPRIRIEIRLTNEEKKMIQEYAKSDGLTVSDYIKRTALKKVLLSNRVEYTTDLRDLNFELNKIGNDVNQMAKHFNSKKDMGPQDFRSFQGMMVLYLEKMATVEHQLKLIYSKLSRA